MEWGVEEVEVGIRGINGDGRILGLGKWTYNTVYRLCVGNCTPKTWIILLASVTSINEINRENALKLLL